MNLKEINIRDPFVIFEGGKYYMYGTRAAGFGRKTSGFDVYVSENLTDWSGPVQCFDPEKHSMNRDVNWAPEVHKYKGAYYMFATFTRENGLRGTFVLKSESPLGPFYPHGNSVLTPEEWEALDGTLYISKENKPYLVFCHEHTQIKDGTVCSIALSDDLRESVGEAKVLFSGSSPYYIKQKPIGAHYITDGPFMYRTTGGVLIMIWSTFIHHKYVQCIAKSDNGEIDGNFVHLPPLITNDGGHGMIFSGKDGLMLTYHTPNISGHEHPAFKRLRDTGDTIVIE